jgi:hypothetical protein
VAEMFERVLERRHIVVKVGDDAYLHSATIVPEESCSLTLGPSRVIQEQALASLCWKLILNQAL